MTLQPINRLVHRGTTIIEVLFAIGIVIVGILGIAAILPLAARNAMQANESSEGQAYALHYYSDFMIRGLNQASRWRWYNDQLSQGARYVDFVNSASVPSATSVNTTRTASRNAICIDPGFFGDASTLQVLFPQPPQISSFPNNQPYRPGLFPYYQDNFDPTTNPYANPGFYSGSVASDLPRLLRMNLADTTQIPARLLAGKSIQQLFSSGDDVVVTADENDKTIPPIRLFENGSARGLSNMLYSWLATLCPREPLPGESQAGAESKYTLSIVVLHRRERTLFAPTGDGKNGIPQGERIATIVPQAVPYAFVGGSGGRITLTANLGFDDNLRTGDWIMLAKHLSTSLPRATVCRWYRIIGVDEDSVITGDLPGGTWTRNVVLEGPDWDFGGSPTQATIVSNVVTVLERVVDIQ